MKDALGVFGVRDTRPSVSWNKAGNLLIACMRTAAFGSPVEITMSSFALLHLALLA